MHGFRGYLGAHRGDWHHELAWADRMTGDTGWAGRQHWMPVPACSGYETMGTQTTEIKTEARCFFFVRKTVSRPARIVSKWPKTGGLG